MPIRPSVSKCVHNPDLIQYFLFQEMSDEGDPNLSGLESDSDGEPWQPNQEMLLSLLEMGISENAAKRVK